MEYIRWNQKAIHESERTNLEGMGVIIPIRESIVTIVEIKWEVKKVR